MSLIRREDLLAAYDAAHKGPPGGARKLIAEAPEVDAVEVVRCRDCRYWRHEVNTHTHWVCVQHSFNDRLMYTTPDFYCADGKRGG